MRWTQTRPDAVRIAASTTVVMTELTKFSLVLLVLALQHGYSLLSYLRASLTWTETLRFAVPALCFTLQTNVLWLGISLLDPPTYMVTGQLKISLTALFAACMLGQTFHRHQLVALALLQIGIVMVQVGQMPQRAEPEVGESFDSSLVEYFVGIVAVIGACASSGFASVYFEQLLKAKASQHQSANNNVMMFDASSNGRPKMQFASHASTNDIWLRNLQLGLFALPLSCIGMMLVDGRQVLDVGLTYGYDSFVWFTVLNSSLGGLLVAAVMKYCDNVLKGFATTVSIVMAAVVSAMWFDFEPTAIFLEGTVLVVVAVIMYGWPAQQQQQQQQQRQAETTTQQLQLQQQR